jgi:hypothetical protein
MSGRTERPRPGFGLLLAIVFVALAALVTLALVHASSASMRGPRLEAGISASESLTDSVSVRGHRLVANGGWKALATPGRIESVDSGSYMSRKWQGQMARLSWTAILLRAASAGRTGVPGVSGASEVRTLIPLRSPIEFPAAAVTGTRAWIVDALATVLLPPSIAGPELSCRTARAVTIAQVRTPSDTFNAAAIPLIDPDTITGTVRGLVRLPSLPLARPMTIIGMVVVGSDLRLNADLRVTGVLFTTGSVITGPGRLDVTGAVIAADSGGGQSRLGSGDRVRYDACAIRRALDHVTRPAPTSTWTHLRVF